MMKKQDIRIRDPFVVPVAEQNCYYMFGTTGACWASEGKADSILCRKTTDFETFSEPITAFKAPEGFWSDEEFWAPEVYRHNGTWYMFASFKQRKEFGGTRGTAVLKSQLVQGPYEMWSDGFVTPQDWWCLDGTFYVDNENRPWMIFCREWTQTVDGEMYAVKLTGDLRSADGDPILLFTASQAPWSSGSFGSGKKVWVTDGPFMIESNGALLMLWSSFYNRRYAIGIAQSVNGKIDGGWEHREAPLLETDCGHGMVFDSFEGEKFLAIHQPNSAPNERLSLVPLGDFQL